MTCGATIIDSLHPVRTPSGITNADVVTAGCARSRSRFQPERSPDRRSEDPCVHRDALPSRATSGESGRQHANGHGQRRAPCPVRGCTGCRADARECLLKTAASISGGPIIPPMVARLCDGSGPNSRPWGRSAHWRSSSTHYRYTEVRAYADQRYDVTK